MEAEIRAARLGEEPAVIAMYEWLFAPPGERPRAWDPRRAEVALRSAIQSHDACGLVAVRIPPGTPGAEGEDVAGVFLGFATVYQDIHSVRFGYRAWVEDLAVDPECRSQGIGAALLAAARDWARERGAAHLELDSAEARADAHRFYEREGAAYRAISFGWEL